MTHETEFFIAYFVSLVNKLMRDAGSMRTFIKLFIFIHFSVMLSAQEYNITGRVLNEQTQEPSEFVNVLLVKNDSINPQGTITNEKGIFSLRVKEGNYILRLEQFGQRFLNREISITEDTDLGDLFIEQSILLEGVVAEGSTSLIKQKADRLVFNIENSFWSEGRNLIEILEVTPLINIYGENLSIIGKSGAGIVVNGKPINLKGSALIDYLRSLQSENVRAIEVITSPSAKGNAQGNGGGINIIMKQKPAEGWNGDAFLSYKQRAHASVTSGITFNYVKNKLKVSANVFAYQSEYSPYQSSTSQTETQLINNEVSKDIKNKGLAYFLSFNYKIRENTTFGLVAQGDNGFTNTKENSIYKYKQEDNNVNKNSTLSDKNNTLGSISLNAFYRHKFKKGGGFNLLSAYSKRKNDMPTTFYSENRVDNTTFKTSPFEGFTVSVHQLGIELPWKWMKIEPGIRYAFIENSSDFKFFTEENNTLNEIFDKANYFIYKEKTIAAYLATQKEIAEKWTIQAGLRYENTYVQGENKTIQAINEYEYDDFFPSLNILYNFTKSKSISLHYNKRITRPNLNHLNPYRKYDNLKSYFVGNPYLEPTFMHNFGINYLRNKYTISIYYQKQKDINSLISKVDDNSNTIKTFEKAFNQYNFGINANYHFSLFNFWSTALSADVWYSESEIINPALKPLKGYSGYLFMSNSFNLDEDKIYQFQINYYQFFTAKQKNIITKPHSNLSARLTASFFNKRLYAYVEMNDILKSAETNAEYYQTNLQKKTFSYEDSRAFTIGLSYKFGNEKLKETQNDISVEEEGRK
ncbi:TonB-dependent receptor [Weeksellaceae bacterium TAE3-ERU29]|nr:TonB-dependent receptor [Weeksellaceae bacterium TAE3-ERU29]